jgi:uncharacterized surface protein with fasciclin (FAS1) repeats
VELDPDANNMTVNSTYVVEPDLFASNGVIHIVDDILLPSDFRLLNSAEKVLLTLNATRFVSLLRETNLSDTYVGQEQTGRWTILAPSDDVLDNLDRWESPSALLSKRGSQQDAEPTVDLKLADMMRYHILPGKLQPKDFVDGALLPTEFMSKKLGGDRQMIKVEVGRTADDAEADRKIGDASVRLGEATVLSGPGENLLSVHHSLSECH